jgi:RNA polymerase sigma-70 factor (ECF subfamily)
MTIPNLLPPARSDAARASSDRLYREHRHRVARWVIRLGGTSADAEDAIQEVFLLAHRELPGFRGDAKVTTWLFRITQNVVRHRQRKDRLRRWLVGSAEEAAGQIPSSQPTPAELVELARAKESLGRAFDRLSDRYRSLLVMSAIEGLSGEEIAARAAVKPAKVWVWLHRARAQLARELDLQPSPRRVRRAG